MCVSTAPVQVQVVYHQIPLGPCRYNQVQENRRKVVSSWRPGASSLRPSLQQRRDCKGSFLFVLITYRALGKKATYFVRRVTRLVREELRTL